MVSGEGVCHPLSRQPHVFPYQHTFTLSQTCLQRSYGSWPCAHAFTVHFLITKSCMQEINLNSLTVFSSLQVCLPQWFLFINQIELHEPKLFSTTCVQFIGRAGSRFLGGPSNAMLGFPIPPFFTTAQSLPLHLCHAYSTYSSPVPHLGRVSG